ncbi:arginase [Plesiocystis pacifica SIR-1]|uniref:Arginase n=1 Tax=Plesiocystis pacifica SIR-1 TaxID=391625 RepID=A6G3Q8_9BACT|nr:arginase [Plesiocystis pacifica]EDM79445.1 arginase [Plesiocystis pacifica SIR-1]
MDVDITNVHLDLGAGRRGTDMGPGAMHVAGLSAKLEGLGCRVNRVSSLSAVGEQEPDLGEPTARYLPAIARLCRALADEVEASCEAGRFPLVLGGDHAQAIGTIAGMSRYYKRRGERLGVVWVDAHTDMNTPQTSPSGNIHGMPLAVLLGHGPAELVAIAGDEPALRPEDVAIIGVRDVDPSEIPLVRQTGVGVYPMSELDARSFPVCVAELVERVSRHTAGVHLSFDLDGVDPREAPGVGTPVPGGLTLRESHFLCEALAATGRVVGMEMVELNPTLDLRNQTGKLAVWLIESALGKTILGRRPSA